MPETSDVQGCLKLTFRDIEITDPHLVRLTLKNVGPTDIASDHFDAGTPLVIDLHCQRFFGLLGTGHPAGSTMTQSLGGPGLIEIRPVLLRRGDQWTIEAIIDGAPKPELSSPLIDTDIVGGRRR